MKSKIKVLMFVLCVLGIIAGSRNVVLAGESYDPDERTTHVYVEGIGYDIIFSGNTVVGVYVTD
ncbi:MAG: hypothetical protein IJ733_16545 [Lachnospiraceae bacterium]|nr:hypothetical protein [Lachnospiraceae bacterium]